MNCSFSIFFLALLAIIVSPAGTCSSFAAVKAYPSVPAALRYVIPRKPAPLTASTAAFESQLQRYLESRGFTRIPTEGTGTLPLSRLNQYYVSADLEQQVMIRYVSRLEDGVIGKIFQAQKSDLLSHGRIPEGTDYSTYVMAENLDQATDLLEAITLLSQTKEVSSYWRIPERFFLLRSAQAAENPKDYCKMAKDNAVGTAVDTLAKNGESILGARFAQLHASKLGSTSTDALLYQGTFGCLKGALLSAVDTTQGLRTALKEASDVVQALLSTKQDTDLAVYFKETLKGFRTKIVVFPYMPLNIQYEVVCRILANSVVDYFITKYTAGKIPKFTFQSLKIIRSLQNSVSYGPYYKQAEARRALHIESAKRCESISSVNSKSGGASSHEPQGMELDWKLRSRRVK